MTHSPDYLSKINTHITSQLQSLHFPYLFEEIHTSNAAAADTSSLSQNAQYDENGAVESDKHSLTHLPPTKTIHLDHAASTLYSIPILSSLTSHLSHNLYLNPHSMSKSSQHTQHRIQGVRQDILRFFATDTSKYSVIFTLNASHACKIFAESFDFTNYPKWRYMLQCHNSVLGMREVMHERDMRDVKHFHDVEGLLEEEGFGRDGSGDSNGGDSSGMVVLYPAECNSTGRIYPNERWLELLKRPKSVTSDGKARDSIIVFLDAAKYAATTHLDLSAEHSPDFVALSFYKLFGYPTGLGALLVRNDKRHLLKKTYFSGGTVLASVADSRFHRFRKEIWEQFEDGTLPFLDIVALRHFLKHTLPAFHFDNMHQVHEHTSALAHIVHDKLTSLRHYNGAPVCEIYGWDSSVATERGSIVNFNLKKANGEYIGYSEVEQLSSLHNMNVRTGCFCNAGACQVNLSLDASKVIKNFESGHVCWDGHDLINGSPTGSVRVSFGYCSSLEDAERFLEFVDTQYVEKAPPSTTRPCLDRVHRYKLDRICLYPIKSCLGVSVNDSWELSPNGLLYDREWVLIDDTGRVLMLKHNLVMGTIQPSIDGEFMKITSPNVSSELRIRLDYYPDDVVKFPIFGTETQGLRYGDDVNSWFTSILGFPTYLIRKDPHTDRQSHHANKSTINYSNEGQYLCISRRSMQDVQERLIAKYGKDSVPANTDWLIERFRPNFVIEDSTERSLPFVEDHFSRIQIGSQEFVVQGVCKRCTMINVDTSRLSRENEPLKTLFEYRKVKGRVLFGVLIMRVTHGDEEELRVGDVVRCEVDEEYFRDTGKD